ncbi:MAG: hypothetical protein ACKPE3_15585 [Sphaerospermopsis kisseleviana]
MSFKRKESGVRSQESGVRIFDIFDQLVDVQILILGLTVNKLTADC